MGIVGDGIFTDKVACIKVKIIALHHIDHIGPRVQATPGPGYRILYNFECLLFHADVITTRPGPSVCLPAQQSQLALRPHSRPEPPRRTRRTRPLPEPPRTTSSNA